ncbi:MAG: MBL fold metallo-hydrolase [Candidatus Hecatellaceae archaeon]|nr:MAG: MBL fold metallo-hydrolase [Candidatus Hecatellales archaeon]
MKVRMLVVGPVATNCYIARCEETGEAIVIDPGDEGERILEAVREEKAKVKYVVNTHGHIDHIGANDLVRKALKAPLLIHRLDAEALGKPELNLSMFFWSELRASGPDRTLEDGDEIAFGRIRLKVLHTPGHTPGSICLLSDDVIFTGDTLFAGSIGRTDMPGGSFQRLIHSLKHRIMPLPDGLKVYPGHGPETLLGYEKQVNPYLRSL